MSEFDGEIRINTKINTADAEKMLMKLEEKMQQSAKQCEKIQAKMKELANQKIPTEEFAQVQAQIEKDTASLNKLIEHMDKFTALGGKTDSKAFKSMQYDVEQLRNSIKQAKADKQAMQADGSDYINPKTTPQYQELNTQLQNAQSEFNSLKEASRQAASELLKTGNKGNTSFLNIGKAAEAAKKVVGGVASVAGKVKTAMGNMANKAGKAFSKLTTHTKKSNSALSKFGNTVKQLALSMVVFQVISKTFNAMVESIKSGIQNYAKYSDKFNESMSAFKTSLDNLKNSAGAAAMPIVNALLPGITALCDGLTRAANFANQLFSTLAGKTTWSKAVSQQKDYAKSLDKTAGAAKKTAGALASFDDLNILQKTDSESTGGGTSTEQVQYTEEKIPDSVKKIKEMLGESDWTELGSMIADKINKAMENIDWESIQQEAELIGTRIGTLINGFVAEFDWNLLGKTVAEGINTALIFLNTFLTTVDWTAIGSAFATGINGFVTNLDWNLLGTTIGNGFNMAIDIFYGFVSTLDWSKLGTSLGESIQGALITIDWETLGKSVSDGFIGLLDFITEAIYAIDWKQLGNDVAAVVKNIDWDGVSDALFEGIGAALGALAAFLQGLLEDAWNSVVDWWYDAAYEDGEFTMEGLLNGITEKLTDIGNWIDEHIFQPFMEGFRNVFGIHSPSTVMQEMGGYIIDGLKEGLLGIWEKVEWIITEFKEKLKEAFTNAKNNTISIFSSMKTKMVDIFKGMWSGMKNVINTIINGIEFMVNRVVDGINNMINALNRLSFDFPDWVPQLGGKSFGFSIPTIPTVSIPRLANGGITTGSTLANIGEAGMEAVLPLENNTGWMDDLASKLASKMPDYSGAKTVMLAVDGKEFARINLPYLQDEEMRLGIVEG